MAMKTSTKKREPVKGGNTGAVAVKAPRPKKKTSEEVQAIVDQLVGEGKLSKNATEWPDYAERLTDAGLLPKQVTQQMLDLGHARAQVKPVPLRGNKHVEPLPAPPSADSQNLEWLLTPEQEDFEAGSAHFDIWRTRCNRYRVARVTHPSSGGDARFVVLSLNGSGGEKIIANDLRRLEQAFQVVEDYHCRQTGHGLIRTNARDVIKEAGKNGMHRLREQTPPPNGNGHVARTVAPQRVETAVKPKSPPSAEKTAPKKPKPTEPSEKKAARAPRGSSTTTLLDYAVQVLAEEGRPLAVLELTEKVRAKGWQTNGKTPHLTLGARIYTEIKERGDASRFVRSGPGLFAFRG